MSRYRALGLLLAALFAAGCNDELIEPKSEAAPQFLVTGVTSMSVGFGEVCRTFDTGVVACEGNQAQLTGTHSAPNGFVQVSVSAGSSVACGVRGNGNATCFGQDGTGINLGNWDGGGIWTKVAVGSGHLCFLATNKRISCAGSNSFGQAPNFISGDFTDISAGLLHTCGVTDVSGNIVCWGFNGQGQAPGLVTPSVGLFTKVKAGEYHTCGLTTAGTIECFGRNDVDQGGIRTGNYIDLALEAKTTCGLKANGVVKCWGENTQRREAAYSKFIAIDGNGKMVCGLRADGHFECFSEIGSDDSRTIPASAQLFADVYTANRVGLTWVDVNTNEIRVELERSAVDGAGDPIAYSALTSLRTDATTYADRTVTPGSYRYRIRFCNRGGCSDWRQTDVVVIPTSIPAAPTNLVATSVGMNQIDLAWTDNASNEYDFYMERRVFEGEWSSWEMLYGVEIGADETTYIDDELDPITRHQYRIQACNVLGCSAFATSVVIQTATPPIPAAPTGVVTEIVTGVTGTRVRVQWDGEGGGEGEGGDFDGTYSKVRRRIYDGTAWSAWVVVEPEHFSTTYHDSDITADTRYQYAVSVCSAGGCSAYVSSNAITTPSSL